MSKDKTGGPAFPCIYDHDESGAEIFGMDLRDYFAAKAMQGDLACNHESIINNADTHAEAAEAYYRIADAMLKAREL